MTPQGKIKLALLFGGRSTEHEVSLVSALGLLEHINRDKYTVLPVKISRKGEWMLIGEIDRYDSKATLDKATGKKVMAGDSETGGLYIFDRGTWTTEKLDVVFPILHGTFGEDGTLQGLLRMAGLPCVGAGVLASALCMDKILMKQVFFQNDLPSTDYLHFLRSAWRGESETIMEGVKREIGFPCFVKPANTGSSVGIVKVKSERGLKAAIDTAAGYDRKILVEKAVDAREFEVSVLGNDDPVASPVGEIIPGNEFYDYSAKYEDAGSKTRVPADLPRDVVDRIRALAVRAYKAVDCSGMGRVDFLMDRATGTVYLNEINTLPGFTPISMYPKLWEADGLSYSRLIDRLVDLALQRHRDLQHSRTDRG